MALPRAMGIETEYGIVGGEANKVVKAYKPHEKHENLGPTNRSVVEGLTDVGGHIGGDYGTEAEQMAEAYGINLASNEIGESPGIGSMFTRAMNAMGSTFGFTSSYYGADSVLDNGARFYVDMGHPEYSTPEASCPRNLVVVDKAGERVVHEAAKRAGGNIKIYKNNSDGRGSSFGCHENYIMKRVKSGDFEKVVAPALTPFFVTRQIFTGAGKVGIEEERSYFGYRFWRDDREPEEDDLVSFERAKERALDAIGSLERHFLDMPDIEEVRATIERLSALREKRGPQQLYQLSQRADFFCNLIGLETTRGRPIINTRDEPHADQSKYMRLHVINGDANMCEVATFLKAGTTALVLDMLEDGIIPAVELDNPVKAFKGISVDQSRKWNVRLRNGRTSSAVAIQREYLESAKAAYAGRDYDTDEILGRWERTLDALERNPMELMGQVDWVTKMGLLHNLMDRNGATLHDKKIKNAALQYHDVDRSSGLFYFMQGKGICERVVSDSEIEHAVHNPPADTRAFLRGKATGLDFVSGVDWGGFTIQGAEKNEGNVEVKLNEPFAGTADQLGDLFEGEVDARSLTERLRKIDGITVQAVRKVVYRPFKGGSKRRGGRYGGYYLPGGLFSEELEGGND